VDYGSGWVIRDEVIRRGESAAYLDCIGLGRKVPISKQPHMSKENTEKEI